MTRVRRTKVCFHVICGRGWRRSWAWAEPRRAQLCGWWQPVLPGQGSMWAPSVGSCPAASAFSGGTDLCLSCVNLATGLHETRTSLLSLVLNCILIKGYKYVHRLISFWVGQGTQGLFIIETDLWFLTSSSLVLGSIPGSVSEIIPVKRYGRTGPILHLKYAFSKCSDFVKLWSAFAFLKRETPAAFPATYALACSAEKVKRWWWLSLFKSGVRDFKKHK